MDKKSKIIIIATLVIFILLFGISMYTVLTYNHKNGEQSNQEQTNDESDVYYIIAGDNLEINLTNGNPVILFCDASDIQNDTIMSYTWEIDNTIFGYGMNVSFQIRSYMAGIHEIRLTTIDYQNNTNYYVSELIIRR